jgi:hypothetical protein
MTAALLKLVSLAAIEFTDRALFSQEKMLGSLHGVALLTKKSGSFINIPWP